MPDTIYFFIDGGYVRSKYAGAMQRVFGVENAEPAIEKLQSWCQTPGRFGLNIPRRFFYYDCVQDIRKPAETHDQYNQRIEKQNTVFRLARSLQGFHVRLGSISGTYKKLRQKKVDVLLAVEMLDHAVRKNMDMAVLISGDSDFAPLTEAVMRLGTWVEVCYHRSGASEDLYTTADRGIELTFHDLWNWGSDEFRQRFPLPQWTRDINYEVNTLLPRGFRTGRNRSGHQITVGERGDRLGEFFIYEHTPGYVSLFTYNDRGMLESYYAEQFGTIAWNAQG
jgi:uncharacterized LabA/DUF88 family protein